MKNIVCISHDPGGYDVISPVYNWMNNRNISCVYIPLGPSKKIAGYGMDDNAALDYIKSMIAYDEVAILVTGTSWGNDIELKSIDLCKKNKIMTLSILDYWCNYRMRFLYKEKDVYVLPDKLFVMDDIAYEGAIADGIDRNIIEIVGSPGLDKYFLGGNIQQASNKAKDGDILFLSDPVSDLYGDSLGYTEFSAFADVIQVCDDLGREIKIKFHPKDSDEIRRQYAAYAVEGDLDNVVVGYNLVIGMATMGLLHTHLLGIPILSYQPGLVGEDMCITNILGITDRIDSKNALKNIMRQSQFKKNQAGNKLIWEDGKSTARVCRRILELINS